MEYTSGLKLISLNPKLIGQLCELIGEMPNIDFPTMGGHFCWDTLVEVNGWKVQKNKFMDNCRLLDKENIRRAWGSESKMKLALATLSNSYSYEVRSTLVYCPSCGSRVPEGRFCKECGRNMN